MSKPKLKKYRPANGSEGDWFMSRFCYQCSRDDMENDIMCPIIGQTMALEVDDLGRPLLNLATGTDISPKKAAEQFFLGALDSRHDGR